MQKSYIAKAFILLFPFWKFSANMGNVLRNLSSKETNLFILAKRKARKIIDENEN